MSTHPDAAPTTGRSASQFTKPLREIGALVLVGVTAVLLFVALLDLLIPYGFDNTDFTRRAERSFYDFVGLATIGFPLLAVLLATHVQPPVSRAKLITTVALVEYAVAAFFGVVFGLLVGVVVIAEDTARGAFQAMLARLAWLALLGVAGYAVYQVWRNLYYVPKPKQPAGGYGLPPQGYGHPGQPPGYPPQQYGQPGYPPGYPPHQYGQQPGYPPGYPPAPVQPEQGHPGFLSQGGQAGPPGPQSHPGFPGQPPGSYPPPPASAPPVSGAPASGPEQHTPPPGGYAEPTQAIPRPDDERTQQINPGDHPPYPGGDPQQR